MPAYRYFYDQDLSAPSLVLEGDELRHLRKVMRTQLGETIQVVNGRGQLATAVVTEITKDRAAATIQDLAQEAPPRHKTILAQAIPRANRLDIIVEKGTELGVDEFRWFPGSLSEKKTLSPQQLARMRNQTIAALKQSGRLFLPSIEILPPIAQWKAMTGLSFFGDVSPQARPFKEVWVPPDGERSVCFVVGPEGGLSAKEEQKLRSLGVAGVGLHPNILRTDTAPLMAVALMQHWLWSSGGKKDH